jgi:hypothetical protein
LKDGLDDGLDLLHGNLVDVVLQVGHGVGLKPGVLVWSCRAVIVCARWSSGGLSLLTRAAVADVLLDPEGLQISLRAERACCGSAMRGCGKLGSFAL